MPCPVLTVLSNTTTRPAAKVIQTRKLSQWNQGPVGARHMPPNDWTTARLLRVLRDLETLTASLRPFVLLKDPYSLLAAE